MEDNKRQAPGENPSTGTRPAPADPKDPGSPPGCRILILANGSYGGPDPTEWYRRQAGGFDQILCADGGTNHARRFGIVPDRIIGDLDSIDPAERRRMEEQGVAFTIVPAEKDFTDLQLALEVAAVAFDPAAATAKEITIWGGLGDRLDHTLANILSAVPYALAGVRVVFDGPAQAVHLVCGPSLSQPSGPSMSQPSGPAASQPDGPSAGLPLYAIRGKAGDTVSILSLTPRAAGVTLEGFQYPLAEAVLEEFSPIGVSNRLVGDEGTIRVREGALAVFHLKGPDG